VPSQPGMTQEQAAAILVELRHIRQLLERQIQRASLSEIPSESIRMKVDKGWPALGQSNAPVTIVEFTDLLCPYCQKAHEATFQKLKENYIDTGKVRFISRDLPLPAHAYALKAAEAVHCAGEQGKFWQLRDEILAGGKQQPVEDDVLNLAGKL